jgi:uncharacterized protein (TIGR02453 family)
MNFSKLIQFLSELSAHNNKVWFDAHRPTYEALRQDFVEFVQELIFGLAEFDPLVQYVRPKDCLFRINRDTRFSKDKSPYSTFFSAAICEHGRNSGWPVYYFHVPATGRMLLAAGIYMPDAEHLTRIRHYIATQPKQLARVIETPQFKREFGALDGETLKRPPKGYDETTPYIEIIKQKNFTLAKEFSVKRRKVDSVLPQMLAAYRQMLPFMTWLRAAVQ